MILQGAIKKSLILLSKYWKNYHFERVPKNILMVAILFSPTVYHEKLYFVLTRSLTQKDFFRITFLFGFNV